jgi:uncharacterized surface protein with fasciclin (FAS1) repeats
MKALSVFKRFLVTSLLIAATSTLALNQTAPAVNKQVNSTPVVVQQNLLQVLEATGNHKVMLALIVLGGAFDGGTKGNVGTHAVNLRTGGPYTLFAPTDEAFARFFGAGRSNKTGIVDGTSRGVDIPSALLKDRERVRKLILAHLIPGRLTTDDLKITDGTSINNLDGLPFMIKVGGSGGDPALGAGKPSDDPFGIALFINGKAWGVPGDDFFARLLGADMPASNGIVHSLDAVAFVPRTDPGVHPASR